MKQAFLALSLLLLSGCASPFASARDSYAAARSVYDAAETRYRAEQEVCVSTLPQPELCVAEVRRRWAPVRKEADALRSALVSLGGLLGLYDALSATGRTPDPAAVQKAASAALDGALGLSAALVSLGAP